MKRVDSRPTGKIRIIAGRWRGSKLEVPGVSGLRPSSDRVRETLFNWLQSSVGGARCLDLFAGSGALGFEAASRGAAHVTMIERDPVALAGLRASVQKLGADQIETIGADALAWLARTPDRAFDLVFVDPPFSTGLHQKALDALLPWLAADAQVYVETARDAGLPVLAGFAPRREGATREVRCAILHRLADGSRACAPATLMAPSGAEPAS
ncbi:16S rRNA (guanine(966)-N(2))-methyltransferase RsmD [Xanthomonadaceae bacterium JHOS43]|nr:16S rRNA (guanine(966)-N(2))-methyltransferase RsmD [Xanthomonadaceae bacterium JHOS43]